MSNKNFHTLHTLLALTVILNGCSMLKEPSYRPAAEIPADYPGAADSASTAEKGWSTFYADSTLKALIDTALTRNQNLMMALQRIEMAWAGFNRSRAALYPVISGELSVGQRRFGEYTMDGVGNYDTQFSPNISKEQVIPMHLPDYFAGVRMSWEADVWGKLKNRRKAALANYLAEIEAKNWIVTNLVFEIATAYYTLLALDNELEIIMETIQLQEDALAITRVQKDAGKANQLAVQQFEAQLLRSKTLAAEARQKITESETRINFLCGRYPQAVNRRTETFSAGFSGEIHTGVPSQLLSLRPDIRQAELELTASRANLQVARAAFYPNLNITGSLGFHSFNPGFLFAVPQSVAYSLFANLIGPVINRNLIKTELRTATARQKEKLLNYERTVLTAFMEVYNEMSRIRNLEQISSFKTREAQVLSESIGTSSELFWSGRASYVEVLMSQQNALRARLEIVDVRKKQYLALVNIYRALGGGWKK